MPVTKTAKRALRVSRRKASVNSLIISRLEAALRHAKTPETIRRAISLADSAAKKKVIHENKAGRIKSKLTKLLERAVKPKAGAKKRSAKSLSK